MILNSEYFGIKIYDLNHYDDLRGKLLPLVKDNELGLFKEDRVSYSRKGVLRGLHGDKLTTKLFFLLNGAIRFSAVCYDKTNVHYGRVLSKLFYADLPKAILLPPYYLNGHLALEDCILLYKWSEYYTGPENQVTVNYNDPTLDIHWGIENPILSTRDTKGLNFLDI